MPDDLLLANGSHMRQADAAYLFGCVQDAVCSSLVGISNMGKSALLRLMAEPVVHEAYLGSTASAHNFVLIDCNRMLELSEQGFYELILRCVQDQLAAEGAEAESLTPLKRAYDRLIHPASPFDIPLSFNQGITAVCERPGRKLVLLFDEFDQALAGIQGRVFLNLRALKDQYKRTLVYITATSRPLMRIRSRADVSEFSELFAHHTYYLPPLTANDVQRYIQRFASQERITFDQADQAFISLWAGGHPGLLEAICRALGRVTGATLRDEMQDRMIHREVASWLPDDLSVRVECQKIWDQLPDDEQQALLGMNLAGEGVSQEIIDRLAGKHILIGEPENRRFFARSFGEYVHRLRATRRPRVTGIRVDLDSGAVFVDGRETETLTNLEYRLLLLLYGRLNQIVSKYDVVETVWGEDYIDEVDDARIEKLVSRLRNKIEPDPRNPRYVITVRGRGYRMEE